MSLGSDYLNLIDALWNNEKINMWNPTCHATLAYVLDKKIHAFDYERMYGQWMHWVENEDFNRFSWDVVRQVLDISKQDTSVTDAEKDFYHCICETFRPLYNEGIFVTFGIMSIESAPEWFPGLFQSYIVLKEKEREDAVLEYCKTECGMNTVVAQAIYSDLLTQEDILNELYFYITHRRFKTFFPIKEYGYTAQDITQTTYLTPMGAYNYLISLRNNPEKALNDLKKGLPRK